VVQDESKEMERRDPAERKEGSAVTGIFRFEGRDTRAQTDERMEKPVHSTGRADV